MNTIGLTGPTGPKRDEEMSYIAEILSDDVVWLINENRRLISIHQTQEEANYYCKKHFRVSPVIIDRRRGTNGSSLG